MENHADVNIMAVAYVKISVKSGKFTFEVRSESGKLSTIGCHLPPKSTHFGTLVGFIVSETHLPKKFSFTSDFSHFILKMLEN